MDAGKKEFEVLLSQCRNAIERLVYYKIPNKADAEDVIQTAFINAYEKFDTLRDREKFKAWLIRIATNECSLYYRRTLSSTNIPLEEFMSDSFAGARTGMDLHDLVDETLSMLSDKDRQIIRMFYFREMPVKDISAKLHIPVGTVKSRLNSARRNFRVKYPYLPIVKGEINMNKSLLPEILPQIKIERLNKEEFKVKCEQDIGWFIAPRLGEKATIATYDFAEFPVMKKTSETHIKVENKAVIHGIECVEVEFERVSNGVTNRYSFFERLTDTHLQTLASLYNSSGVKRLHTFLDEDFLSVWGSGQDNCGVELNLEPKGIIKSNENGELFTSKVEIHNMDIVGLYTVTIGKRTFDTVREVYFNTYGELVENYIDTDGRVVLFRRFNKDSWNAGKDGNDERPWTERLPNSDRITLNGDIFVHWFNCIPEYVL